MIVDKMENGVWTRTETESKECVATIEIWNNCIFVNDEKYDLHRNRRGTWRCVIG